METVSSDDVLSMNIMFYTMLEFTQYQDSMMQSRNSEFAYHSQSQSRDYTIQPLNVEIAWMHCAV